MNIFISTMSPDDPSWQAAFKQATNKYFFESAIFFLMAVIVFFIVTKIANESKNAKIKTRLFLFRKLGLYVVIFGWVIFTGIIFGIIPTGL